MFFDSMPPIAELFCSLNISTTLLRRARYHQSSLGIRLNSHKNTNRFPEFQKSFTIFSETVSPLYRPWAVALSWVLRIYTYYIQFCFESLRKWWFYYCDISMETVEAVGILRLRDLAATSSSEGPFLDGMKPALLRVTF